MEQIEDTRNNKRIRLSPITTEQPENNEDIINNERFQHDRIQLLNILPEEMWREVFDRIVDPQDKERFINSSLFFRDLFRSQRTQFLFQNVWKVLGKKYEENITTPGSVYRDSEPPEINSSEQGLWDDDDSDHEYEHRTCLVTSLVQRLRSVCKSWDEAVSHFYGNHYLHYQLQNCTSPWMSVERTIEPIINEFYLDKYFVNKFLDHFGTTHGGSGKRNPFFGKSVVFVFPLGDSEEEAVYANEMLRFLTMYGHHLWHCKIYIKQLYSNKLVKFYASLRALLGLMPNLKGLRVHVGQQYESQNTVDDIEPSILEQLETEMSAWPLPALKHLQFLNPCRVSAPIIEELVRCYHHVSTLDVSYLNDEKDHGVFTVPLQLPKLTTLSVSFRTEADFNTFMNRLVPCRLSKLFVNVNTTEFMDWQHIFTVLGKKWADSLTKLEIILPEAKGTEQKRKLYEESQALQLNFPHLQFLKMSMSDQCNLDFLLSVKKSLLSLEIIKRANYGIQEELLDVADLEKGNAIKLTKSSDAPLGDNIWFLFPKLNWILVEQFIRCEHPNCICKSGRRRHQWSLERKYWKSQATKREDKEGMKN